MIQKLKDLEVYVRAYGLAMKVFEMAKTLPKEEMYSLTSQIIRSSRSIAANISEGWAKREYEQVFKQHLIHSLGSASETQTWVDFSHDCGYISSDMHQSISEELDTIGKMITNLHKKWKSR
jgi:four helix bundle protein